MVSTFLYLIENQNCNIPNEWQSTMEQFYNEMKQWVPGISFTKYIIVIARKYSHLPFHPTSFSGDHV